VHGPPTGCGPLFPEDEDDSAEDDASMEDASEDEDDAAVPDDDVVPPGNPGAPAQDVKRSAAAQT